LLGAAQEQLRILASHLDSARPWVSPFGQPNPQVIPLRGFRSFSQSPRLPVSPSKGFAVPPVAPSPTPQPPIEPLTKRELDILELVVQRLHKEIAEQLYISPETVKRHLQNLYQKLQVRGRREAVTRAADLGLLDRD
jgi:DNA-binding NarL/FixJ family response regulator